MKKIIAILILVLIVSAVFFAAPGDKLIVNANVGEHKPVFSLRGGTTNEYGAISSETTNAQSTIETGIDITENNVVVYIALYQAPEHSSMIKYKGTIASLSISASELINTEHTAEKTAIPVASSIAGNGGQTAAQKLAADPSLNNPSDDACIVTADLGETSNVVNFTATYSGHPVAGGVIGTCVYTWTADSTLVPGLYEATITLTYTYPN